MNRLKQIIAAGLLIILPASLLSAAGNSPLAAFPEAQPGTTRYVIELPHKTRDQEIDYGVELVVGRTMQTDGINQVMLAGEISAQTLQGWGYTYYEVSGSLMTISTLMGVSPDQPRVETFVHTAPLRIAYNSRLPVVVYVPENYQLRYRIWSAPEDYQAASRG